MPRHDFVKKHRAAGKRFLKANCKLVRRRYRSFFWFHQRIQLSLITTAMSLTVSTDESAWSRGLQPIASLFLQPQRSPAITRTDASPLLLYLTRSA